MDSQFKEDARKGRIGVDALLDLIETLQRELQRRDEQIEELKEQLADAQTDPKAEKAEEPTESFSVEAEERRQEERGKKRRKKQQSDRRGRVSTEEKVAQAARKEKVFPEGVPKERCKFSHTRPVWRLENGQAVLVAYEIYRGPKNAYGKIPGVLGRCEFGLEIVVTIAYLVHSLGLSFDKVCSVLNFFHNLQLRKSQADALLNQLQRHWEREFDLLCTLLAHSAIVHTDETGWSINSVWAFLSEQVRLLFFGVHKDAATLHEILDSDTFAGILISDDAAVYANFTHAQKCWAHLLRKAIKLTLLEPDNEEYRRFTDRLLEIYREACRVQRDQRLSDAGRKRKVMVLEDEIVDLCLPMWVQELPSLEGTADNYRLLVNELMRLLVAKELFTFVTASPAETPNGEVIPVGGTNNEAERTLRGAAEARKTGRTNKTPRGARRKTVIVSVLESLRQQLPSFSLSSVVNEILSWSESGQSCFARLLDKLGLSPPTHSVLDIIIPGPDG